MPEGNPRVWFVCMYCKRAYKKAKELVEHKKQNHFQQLQEYLSQKGRGARTENIEKATDGTNNADDGTDAKDKAAAHGKPAESGATDRLSITEASAGTNELTAATSNSSAVNKLSITAMDHINRTRTDGSNTEATSAPTNAPTTIVVKLPTKRMKVEPLKLCLTRTSTTNNIYAVSPPKNACPKCGKQFLSPVALKIHVKKLHRTFKCSKCNKIFKTTVSFKMHQGLHGAKQFRCYYCPESFCHPRARLLHAQEEHQDVIQQMFNSPTEPVHPQVELLQCKREPVTKWERFHNHICSICQRGFAYQKNLDKHMLSTHSEEPSGTEAAVPVTVQHTPLDCPLCKKKLSSKHSVKEHLMRIHGLSHDAVSKIELNGSGAYGFVNIKTERVTSESRTAAVPCQNKEATFVEDKIIQKLQCGVVSYECRICWISFSYKTDAVSHVREVHWGSQ